MICHGFLKLDCMKIDGKENMSKLNVDGRLMLYVILQIKICRKVMQYDNCSNIALLIPLFPVSILSLWVTNRPRVTILNVSEYFLKNIELINSYSLDAEAMSIFFPVK